MRWLRTQSASGAHRSVDDPIESEFEFHIDRRADALRAEGLSPDDAQIEARRRFGDRAMHLEECRRYALEDAMTTTRVIRWTAGITMIGLIVAVTLLSFTAGRQAAMLRELDARMRPDTAQTAQAAAEEESSMSVDAVTSQRVVHVGGDIPRPGTYALPSDMTLTASRVASAAGGGPPARLHVQPIHDFDRRLEHWRGRGHEIGALHGRDSMVVTIRTNGTPAVDLRLEPGDTVWIESLNAAPTSPPLP